MVTKGAEFCYKGAENGYRPFPKSIENTGFFDPQKPHKL